MHFLITYSTDISTVLASLANLYVNGWNSSVKEGKYKVVTVNARICALLRKSALVRISAPLKLKTLNKFSFK